MSKGRCRDKCSNYYLLQDLADTRMTDPMDTRDYTPEKSKLEIYQKYRTISQISHPSEAMLKTELIRLKRQSEEIIAKDQTRCRAGKSTT